MRSKHNKTRARILVLFERVIAFANNRSIGEVNGMIVLPRIIGNI